MKILIIVYATFVILSLLSTLMSKPNSRIQKISLEIFVGLIGFAVICLLAYWLVTSAF